MRRLDRLVLGEIVGPFIFGAALFSVLIMAGQFLFQFTNYIVRGANPFLIAQLIALNIPAVLVLTFPMSVLLSALLGFGRLSGESEITAVRAAGASLYRIMAPVAAFGLLISLVTFGASEWIVPAASSNATELQAEIARKIEGIQERATQYPIVGKSGKVEAFVNALGFDLSRGVLTNVYMTVLDSKRKPSSYLIADELEYKGAEEWKIIGRAEIMTGDGQFRVAITDGVWPNQVPKIQAKPAELLAAATKRGDNRTMGEMREIIESASRSGAVTRDQLRNLEYLYWNKLSVPSAALVYSLVGAPLGIRNHRTGAAAGFWVAILIIFCYFLLQNVMGIAAGGGAVPPVVASFTPLLIGLFSGIFIIYQKNK